MFGMLLAVSLSLFGGMHGAIYDGFNDGGGVAGPLDGPFYLHYDASDMNGNGDGNAGWANLDLIGTVSVSKNWESSAATSTDSLSLGVDSGNPDFRTSCSPSGLPCVRLDGNDSMVTAGGGVGAWAGFYANLDSMTCVIAATNVDNDSLGGWMTTKVLGAFTGMALCHDTRTTSDRLYAQFYTSGTAQVYPSPGTPSIGTTKIISWRLDSGTDLLTGFVGSTAQTPTGNTAALTPATDTQFRYLRVGLLSGFSPPYVQADVFEIICWPVAKTDAQIADIVTALETKWGT